MTTQTLHKPGRRPKLVEGSLDWMRVRAQVTACQMSLAEICEANGISRTTLHNAFPGLRRKSYQDRRNK